MTEPAALAELTRHTGRGGEAPLAFWRERLERIEEPLRLAGAGAHRAAAHLAPAPTAWALRQPALGDGALQVVRRISNASPLGALVVVLAAVAHLAGACTRRRLVVIETPPLGGAGAPPPAGELVPLVFDLEPGWQVKDLLHHAREIVSGSYGYQDFPVQRLRRGRREPLTDVLVRWPALHAAPENGRRPHALELGCQRPDALELAWRHDAARLPPDFVDRLAAALGAILRGFGDAERPLSDLQLLDPALRRHVLATAAGPALPPGGGTGAGAVPARFATVPARFATVPARFAAMAAARGGHPALDAPGGQLSYRDLEERSGRLARHLVRRLGVGRDHRVGVVASRSADWLIGLLAVLRAGAAYLPIDPSHPRARLVDLIRQAAPRVVLDPRDQLRDAWAAQGPGAPAFAVPRSGPEGLAEEEEAAAEAAEAAAEAADAAAGTAAGGLPFIAGPGLGPGPGDLAYVLYTSGSTGRPKGVMVEHGGFVNMIDEQIRRFGLGPADRVLQFADAAFDASLAETFTALLSGATLVLVERETLQDPDRFAAYLEERRVTVLSTTPLYLAALAPRPLPSVRCIITAGEAAHAESTLRYGRTKQVWNAYGPTEAAVCATIHRVDPLDPYLLGIPIGRPLANTSVYVLDAALRLLPPGLAGEICIAGAGVARGYLGEEPAGDRFAADPFDPGRRLYRTGDLGAYRDDGELLFLGRIDDQAKVRGYRIDPAEVRAALLAHPGVDDACVAALEQGGQTRDLAAYYTRRDRVELWPSIAEFHVYDDVVYRSMARDEVRNRAYRAALERRVDGKTVLEVGPGPDLVLTRLCVEAGARRVIAVELSAEAAARARELARRLGLADRIEILHGDISAVEPPELVDCCVSEIVGSIGGAEGAAVLLARARRWLKDPGDPAAHVPARSITFLAAVELPLEACDLRFPETAAHYVERIFAQVGRPFDLRLCVKGLPPERLLSSRDILEDLDFRADPPAEESHEVRLRMRRGGAMTGLLAWLHLVVDGDFPQEAVDVLESAGSWLPVYLPLAAPLRVESGDELRAMVSRTLCANRLNPDFGLDGHLLRGGEAVAAIRLASPHVAAGFRQAPFYAVLFHDGAVPVRPELSAAGLRRFLADRLPAYMLPGYVMELDRLPRTPSGKVDRRALPDPRAGEAERRPAPPRDGDEAALLAVWEEVLGRRPLGVDDNYFSLGGDSIRAIQIAARLRAAGFELRSGELLEHPTVAQAARRMRRLDGSRQAPAAVRGPVPLSPVQAWFFAEHGGEAHFNQSLLLGTPPGERLDVSGLRAALAAVVEHHDALRTRFRRDGAGWAQEAGAPGSRAAPLAAVDLRRAADPPAELAAQAERLQAGLDLERGPLVRAACFHLPAGDRLLLVVHHLLVDWVSWGVLFADLRLAYRQARAGEAIALPPKTDSFQRWAETLARLRDGEELAAERAHWEAVARTPVAPLPLPAGAGGSAADRVGDAASLSLELGAAATADLLTRSQPAHGITVAEVLLTALARWLAGWRGAGPALVLVEGHGREPALPGLDVSRTVGWFTCFYPVVLDLGGELDPAAQLQGVKQALRAVPGGGRGYGLLAYGGSDPGAGERSAALRVRPAVSFNYLGELDAATRSGPAEAAGAAPLVVCDEPRGRAVSPAAARTAELELLLSVVGGRLQLHFAFPARRLPAATARQLGERYLGEVAALIDHCAARQGPAPRRADAAWRGPSQADLAGLFDEQG
jgi:amino acid adenylation domain-containing protein/non-ribosomal peptide synthase protein (TIGR01720 family)